MNYSCLYAVLKYNLNNEIKIFIPHGTLGPARQLDSAIVELALKFHCDSPELKAINRVNAQFNVINISGITSANGKTLDKRFHSTNRKEIFRNQHDWPIKHRVTSLDYTV